MDGVVIVIVGAAGVAVLWFLIDLFDSGRAVVDGVESAAGAPPAPPPGEAVRALRIRSRAGDGRAAGALRLDAEALVVTSSGAVLRVPRDAQLTARRVGAALELTWQVNGVADGLTCEVDAVDAWVDALSAWAVAPTSPTPTA